MERSRCLESEFGYQGFGDGGRIDPEPVNLRVNREAFGQIQLHELTQTRQQMIKRLAEVFGSQDATMGSIWQSIDWRVKWHGFILS
jgi:hypothetical protein